MQVNPSAQKFCVVGEGSTKMEVHYVIGEVVGTQTRYSTSVSGGNVYSTQIGNQVSVHSSPLVSHETQHSQMFLRTAQGTELEIKATDCAVGFRPGQWATVLIGHTGTHWNYIGVINHNTLQGEVWSGKVGALVPSSTSGLTSLAMTLFCAVFLPASCIGGMTNSSGAAGFAATAFVLTSVIVVAAIARGSRYQALLSQLQGVVDEMQRRVRAQAQSPAPAPAPHHQLAR
jgi:hypothetical protein